VHGRRDGYSLGPSELEHALDILPEEGSFDGKFVGTELNNKRLDLLLDQLQPEVVVFPDRQPQDAHFQQLQLVARASDESIPHYHHSRVDAQNYFGLLLQREDLFLLLIERL